MLKTVCWFREEHGCKEKEMGKFKGRGEFLFKYMESGMLKIRKECVDSELRSASGWGFPPKPYTQKANEGANNMINRNLKKLNRISDVVKEIRKCIEEQDVSNGILTHMPRNAESCARIWRI